MPARLNAGQRVDVRRSGIGWSGSNPVAVVVKAVAVRPRGGIYIEPGRGHIRCFDAQADLQAAAEQGNAKADSVLGTMYATGHCVSRDLPLAYRWFAKALQQDPSNARLQRDLQVLWNQMTAAERQIAMRH